MHNAIAGGILVALAVFFGLLGKPTEMGLIVACGTVVLFFLNIDRFEPFKGGGIEAEMREAVEKANATIDELRAVAVTSGEAVLTTLMPDKFFDGTTLRNAPRSS